MSAYECQLSTTNEESVGESFDPVVSLKKSNILKLSSSYSDDNNTELLGDAKFVDEMGDLLLLSSTSNR